MNCLCPNWVRIYLRNDGWYDRTGYHILNEIVIMVKKIIPMMIIMIINKDNTSNDVKDDEDTGNRYDSI